MGLHFFGRNHGGHAGQRKSKDFPLDVRRSIEFAPSQNRSEMHILSILRRGASIAGARNVSSKRRASPLCNGFRRFAHPIDMRIAARWSCILVVLSASPVVSGCKTTSRRGSADDLEDLIEKHTAARGGSAAIESVHTVAIRLRITEPKFAVEALYQASRTGRMRIDVFSNGKRVYSEGYDGHEAWQLPEDAERATVVSASGSAALRHGLEFPTNLRGLHEMRTRGHQLALVGRELIDGTNYYVLELRLQDGFATYLYLNPTTYLIERQRDIRALHSDADPTQKWIERRFEEFRKLDGRIVAFKGSEADMLTGQVIQTTEILELRTNPPLTDQAFARP